MAVEEMPGGGVVVTGEDIPVVALLMLATALAFKINTGREFSRVPALTGAKNLGVIPKGKRGNAKQALALTVEKIRETRPDYTPNSAVAKALAS